MALDRPDGGEAVESLPPPLPAEQMPFVDGLSEDKLKKLGNFILQGMNENEAATLAGIERLDILKLRRTSDTYNNYIERKKLEFKHKHLKVLSQKPDAKISQWLLERLSPDEFSTKQKRVEMPTNVMAAIIKDIQEGDGKKSSLAFAYQDNEHFSTQRAPGDAEGARTRLRSVLE